MEQTLLLIKPDGVARGLTEEILSKIESSGLIIKKKAKLTLSKDKAERLYAVHKGKEFYQGLIKLITSGPLVATLIEGENAVKKVRDLMGVTDPRKANPGTIRGDLKEENVLTEDGIIKNIVHGSDSVETAKEEIKIFF
ncbi:MAG: nucleoside-diphosphate kinase [Candidatus Saganbacteria bacterium]|nr:nucleoside-diphosphate kinase [Candidatus Saganbacteria bacterium]